jgi:hypothetical protein
LEVLGSKSENSKVNVYKQFIVLECAFNYK